MEKNISALTLTNNSKNDSPKISITVDGIPYDTLDDTLYFTVIGFLERALESLRMDNPEIELLF